METTYEWRGDFDNAELNALHAGAFSHRPLEEDWKAQVNRHSLGWVCARDDGDLVGFVNVPWDGGIHAFLLDTMVSARAGRQGIGTRLVEVAVDEARGTVRQVWSYGERPDERLFAGFQGGAFRLPRTGNTFITYGGICSHGGVPANEPDGADIRARLVEVTPQGEVVLDLRIGGEADDPKALSVFRSEFVPGS